jgi:alanine racemase
MRQGQVAARLERTAALRREAQRQCARFERMRILAETLSQQRPGLAVKAPLAPAAPARDDDAAWTTYLRELEAVVSEIETLLARAGVASSEQMQAMQAASVAAPSIDQVLSAYALQHQLRPGLDAAQTEQFRKTAARILGRLELAQGTAMPAALETLAREIAPAQAPS